jgi:capsular polysaccharide export protein
VTHPPLLRAPPFPWADAGVTRAGGAAAVAGIALPPPRSVLALLHEAKVGGGFWQRPVERAADRVIVRVPAGSALADLELLVDGASPTLWVAAAADRALEQALAATIAKGAGQEGADWSDAAVDPWSALDGARRLVAHGDDEWVALAACAQVPVTITAPGRFGAPGDDAETIALRVLAELGRTAWRDPFTDSPSTLLATIDVLATWRAALDGNRAIAVACGMAWWKRDEIRRFLWHPARRLRFLRHGGRAVMAAQRRHGAVAIWPSRVSPALLQQAQQRDVPLVRVEDGFVRSVGLGVDLVPPSSVVVDAQGIHFDPSGPSDLETILAQTRFGARLLERAGALRRAIVAAGISKYAADTGSGADAASTLPQRAGGRRLVLVPGQVEDDMSVRAGGGGLASNLELVRRARMHEPDAEIWFRPHPDVDAGHRKGAVPDEAILEHADRVVRGGGMAPLLERVDGVHVLTSLTGFEALLRGRDVTCHGTPFYAGWGLTRDLGAVPDRRGRVLPLDALVAGVLILYPRYLDPVTGLPCPPEVLVGRMADAQAVNRLQWVAPLRRWQGRLMTWLR